MTKHVPVLLDELIDLLQPVKNNNYIDATLGGGGMAHAILEKTSPKGVIVGIEQDKEAIGRIKKSSRLKIVHGNFRDIDLLVEKGIVFAGIYFDLGISTDQLEDETRGISFQNKDAPLDMRMSVETENFTASQLLNNADEFDIVKVFSSYGQEKKSKTVAREIVRARKIKPFETVKDLTDVIEKVYPLKYYKRYPGTKVWQALRIAVNDELESIKTALPKAFDLLQPGGRLIVISFHSLEDKIIKQYFKSKIREGVAIALHKKAITPTVIEIKRNPRSRSAKLRGIQKDKNKNEKQNTTKK